MRKNIIAFVHIEKAGGSSLINILRYNFPLTHCEIKPLSKDSSHVFSSCDMKKILKINPWVNSISGHSIKPFSNLKTAYPNIRYISLLRNPVHRYLSQYLYWGDVMGYKGDFRNFMDLEKSWNFQVKKIAGVEDIELAKKIIDSEFLLVGIVEEFVGFLLVLKRKITTKQFTLFNYHLNKGRDLIKKEIFMEKLDQYLPEIKERNTLDIELYNYVKNKWMQEKNNYGPSFSIDLKNLEHQSFKLNNHRRYINFLYQNLYYKRLISILRITSGRKARGGY